MPPTKLDQDIDDVRRYRNSRLYRPLARVFREYNRFLVAQLHERGFTDFSPAFPQILSNLDTKGTRVGVIAARAGMTRQAAGKLIIEIERCGYVRRSDAKGDARATVVRFTPRGRRLLETVIELVEEMESRFASIAGAAELDRVRIAMGKIADAIDPDGAFGRGDEEE